MIEKNEETRLFRHLSEKLVAARDLVDYDDARSSCRFTFPENTSTRLRLTILSKLLAHIEQESGPLYGFSSGIFPDKKWEKFISYLQRTGIVRGIQQQRSFNDEIPFADVHLRVNIDRIDTDGHRSSLGFNRGTATTYDEALSKACGEFLERYSLYTYRQKDLVRASLSDIHNKVCLDPSTVASFEEQKRREDRLLAFDKKSRFYWARGKRLVDGQEALIPAQLIYWNYCTHHKHGLEPYIREPNTNGAAGGFTETEAVVSGLLELIQRDGFLLYWYNRTGPPQIDIATIEDKTVQRLLHSAQRFNFRVVLLDTTTDLCVPACTCVLLDESGVGPAVAVGGGCDHDPAKAIERSIIEACSIHNWLRKKPFSVFFDASEAPFSSKYIGQTERAKIWAEPSMLNNFSFFLSGKTMTFSEFARNGSLGSDEEQQLAALIKTLSDNGPGFEPYYFAAQNEILDDVGYHAVKVIVPELIPLHLNEWNAATGARRIHTGFEKLGHTPAVELNPLPHPFP